MRQVDEICAWQPRHGCRGLRRECAEAVGALKDGVDDGGDVQHEASVVTGGRASRCTRRRRLSHEERLARVRVLQQLTTDMVHERLAISSVVDQGGRCFPRLVQLLGELARFVLVGALAVKELARRSAERVLWLVSALLRPLRIHRDDLVRCYSAIDHARVARCTDAGPHEGRLGEVHIFTKGDTAEAGAKPAQIAPRQERAKQGRTLHEEMACARVRGPQAP